MSKQVWLILWGVFSVGGGAIILSFFCFPENVLHAVSRSVSVPHDDCLLCGMTRAFCAISRGDFSLAYQLNSGSLYLFFGCLFAFGTFLAFCLLRALRIMMKRSSALDTTEDG